MSDFEAAIERIIAGLEKKNKLINKKEREIVAYHESGHAIIGYFTPGADQVQKVSIVPRGIGALGYTLQMPLEDRYLMTKNEILGKIIGYFKYLKKTQINTTYLLKFFTLKVREILKK